MAMRPLKDRHRKIISLLETHKEMDMAGLLGQLAASEATIRRDLGMLEENGYLTRTVGGARLRDTPSLVARTFDERGRKCGPEKEAIARAAAELVRPGMVVAIDSGTTSWRVAALLKKKGPLTVITSALGVIEELGSAADIALFCMGGQFRLENLDFIGDSVTAQLARVHADIAILGADALIPGKGLFCADYFTSLVSQAFSSCCARCVVVADHSKFHAQGTFLGVAEEKIHQIITDAGIEEGARRLLEKGPCVLTIVETEKR
jgi:DeoR/GlpR family transcriptional regulator of sugar metabolism